MFDKILIANRGEIACRVMKTAQAMGVKTVAVYSDADAAAMHVAMADQAVALGGARPEDSYLKGDAIIQAALQTGAQAIHPGYGFLSENPDFVDAVQAAGLMFIGPDADAIRAMGLKGAAKSLMEQAGVPCVPGYHGDDQSESTLMAEAENIGYPVLIKAVAGGGGKGMRLVERAADFAAALASAQAEARGAFGNDKVLIEKYILSPRHIEVQVFGDGQNFVHLYERDCSLQRRHQKVIEEAPAPDMPADVRAAMGDAATRAAAAIGYKGAGTIEFIVDGSGGLRKDGFWFMEMNTRLQVEHPVTEAITGVDLVEWQLRVAAGEALPMAQDDIPLMGHAFEARLYAEDVPAGFLPATGRLSELAFPEFARADSGVRSGDEITPFYDPMIAKIITHGATRAVALKKLDLALSQTQVAGTVTNLAFLGALTQHAGFAAGQVDTGLIARDIDALQRAPVAQPVHFAAALMARLGLDAAPAWDSGFSLWAPMRQTHQLRHGDETVDVAVQMQGRDIQLDIGADQICLSHNGRVWRFGDQALPPCHVAGDHITVFDGYGLQFTYVDPLAQDAAKGAAGNHALAPMPGLIRAVMVAAGDQVEEGAPLCIMEAMKMEQTIAAPRAGIIAEVLVREGDQVEAGAALIVMEEDQP